jgi:hypothetical protein
MIHNEYGEKDHTMSPESCRRVLKPRVIPNNGKIAKGAVRKWLSSAGAQIPAVIAATLTVWSPSVSDKSQAAE